MGYLIKLTNGVKYKMSKTKVLKTPAQRTVSGRYSSSCVPNDIKGICSCGCGGATLGRATRKWANATDESCKQHVKRFLKKQWDKFKAEKATL